MPTSLGLHSPRLAAIRALLTKKGRREQGRFSFEGPTMLEEAVRCGVAIDCALATAESYDRNPVLRDLELAGVPVFLIPEPAFAKVSDLESPPGILAVAPTRLAPLEAVLERPGPILVLDGIGDPGNAGTLLRSAEAFGIAGLLFTPGSVEPHHPKVVRASMGALFGVQVGVAPAEQIRLACLERGRSLVSLERSGSRIDRTELPADAVIVVGSERHGVDRTLAEGAIAVSIPHFGQAESLNAAVAGSIALYELARREKP